MDDNLIAVRTGVTHPGGCDRRCKRASCIFPAPTLQLDLEGRRIVAVWGWPDVRVIDVPNGVRIKIVPTLLLVPISCN